MMVKPFYVDTTGAWVLGHNQTQAASSHLQAGARSELIPSPITKALSTFGGRIAAQTMQYMFKGNVQSLLNYAAFRPYAMMEAIRQALGDNKDGKIVLDPASGFSPIYYWLANEMPETTFIEIDTPKMIADKKSALSKFHRPKNLSLRPANLSDVHLHSLSDNRVDVLVVTGAFVSHVDYRDMLKYVTSIVKDDGYIIAPFPYTVGIENFMENAAVFGRIVTAPIGAISTPDELSLIFNASDFTVTHTLKLSELAERYHKPRPMDVELIAIAQKGIPAPAPIDAELTEIVELNDALHSAKNTVPPFIEFDPESFKRFPRRQRFLTPKK
ncbi:MAG: hypothetical protein WBC91_19615 [Phototrophicaceae bacterium]